MGNRRAQVQRNLGLNVGTNRGQRTGDGYSAINIAGASRTDALNIQPLTDALARAAAQKQIQRERDAATAGLAAVQDGSAEQIQAAVDAETQGGTLEERQQANARTFAKLANQGVIPEAANPHFQVAVQTGTARRLAQQARRELMGRLNEFSNLNDEDGNPIAPPSADEMISEVFGQFEGNFALQSRYGQDQFVAARERIEEEFRNGVAQVRTEALTAEGRRNALNEIVSGTDAEVGLADLAVADEVTPDMLTELSSQLTRHHDAGVRDVRGLFMEGLTLQAAEAAEDDPDRALRLIRQAELVKVGDQPLGEDARAGAQLTELRRSIEEEAERRDAREFQQFSRTKSQLLELSAGRVNQALLEAADSGQSLYAAERAVLAEIRQDPELRQLAAEFTPAQLRATLGDAATSARRIRRALEEDAATTSADLQNRIDVMRAQGFDPGAIRAVMDQALESGELSGRDYIQLQGQLDGDAQAATVTQASPAFQRALRRFSPGTISEGLGSATRKGLLTEQQELQSWVDESVRSLVGNTTNPAERQAALNEFLTSEAFQSRVTEFEGRVSAADQASDGAVREITGLIDGNDFEAAETALVAAERDGLLSGQQADGLRSRQRQVRADLGRQVNNSNALRNAREAAVAEAVRFATEAQPTLTEEDLRSIESDVRAQFQAGASQAIRDSIRGVPPEQQEVALAQLGDQLRTDIVAGFQTSQQRPVEGEAPLVSEESLSALGRRRTARAARATLDEAAAAGVPVSRAALVPAEPVRGVPPSAYDLRAQLDANGFAGAFLGLGARSRPQQRAVMDEQMLGAASQSEDFSRAYSQLRGTDRVTSAELQAGQFQVDRPLTFGGLRALGVPVDGLDSRTDRTRLANFKEVQDDVRERTGLELRWDRLAPGSKYGRYRLVGQVPIQDDQLNPGMVEIQGWAELDRDAKIRLIGQFGFETEEPEEALSLVDGFQEAAARRNAL